MPTEPSFVSIAKEFGPLVLITVFILMAYRELVKMVVDALKNNSEAMNRVVDVVNTIKGTTDEIRDDIKFIRDTQQRISTNQEGLAHSFSELKHHIEDGERK